MTVKKYRKTKKDSAKLGVIAIKQMVTMLIIVLINRQKTSINLDNLHIHNQS